MFAKQQFSDYDLNKQTVLFCANIEKKWTDSPPAKAFLDLDAGEVKAEESV